MSKKENYKRLVAWPEEVERIFQDLVRQSQGESMRRVIKDSIIFAHTNGMYAKRYSMMTPDAPVEYSDEPVKRKKKVDPRREWAMIAGARITDDGMCEYTKYERTVTGRIVRNHRSEKLTSMPSDRAAFLRVVLGPFVSIMEAERAFEAQAEEKLDRGINKLENKKHQSKI